MLTRRGFLNSSAVLGGTAALATAGMGAFGRLAGAQVAPDAPDRYYVFCYFNGGWDILLGLDPRDPQRFNNSNFRSTLIQPGYDQLQSGDGMVRRAADGTLFGPHIGGLLSHFDAGAMSVVRGMSMDTLTHEVGRRRFLTGKPPAGLQARGSNGSVWLASHLGEGEPIPNLSLQVESYNKDQPNYASALRVNSVADLLRALRPQEPLLPRGAARQVSEHLRDAANCPGSRRSAFWQAAEQSRLKAVDMVGSSLDALFDFDARTDEMAALRQHFGFARADVSPEVQAAFAAQAIMGGVSRCVSIEVASGLDTHFDEWERDQGPRQERGFNAISRLIERLQSAEYHHTGTSWFDHTTIIGFSEFSRTALLNDRGGRDHSLTGACLIGGGGVRGGQIIGRSSDVGMTPEKVDLATGAPSPDGEILRPEHILRTLLEEVGLGDAPDLRVGPVPALMRA